ncbi:hypothetical protein LTR37_005779 [Vermiconidia calcicola]|uniref:Uncharacterized protein n=1 Tax=Vermiconidia calcicola TaxID=1690605 RepID=A0ACC3NIH6_9PEZI|nr:hypothetical protein LTR37_005779 [Vermiconidia calcicola]
MLSSSSSVFDSLPTRPPTPPREITKAVDDAINFLDDSNEVDRLLSKSKSEDKPVDGASHITPSSSQDTGVSRRVDFSPHPLYHKISRPGELSSPGARLLKRSPSSKDAKPLKSILKISNAPPPTPDDIDSRLSYFSPGVPGSFSKMLQSVIQQLASASRQSRLDAYLAFNGILKAYSEVPDEPAMVQKMDLLMQFLTRDMAWKDAKGNLDTPIITQALQLTMSIFSNQQLASGLDGDFKMYLVDRSITVIEQAEMPKQVAKLHMWLLAQQHFNASVMTAGKADRIISALQMVEDRFTGNSIVATRLVIYTRLLQQAPAVMLTRIRDWLEHVFHGMLSSIKDIRQRAIETCTRAGLDLGLQPHSSKALQEMFDTEVEAGQSYCEYLAVRLIQMMEDQEMGPYVPQIWSAVILFFRSKRKPLEKWPNFKAWILILQKCLNSSDITIRYQATLAWNKLVFAIMPDASTTKPMMSVLKVPICSGLEKRGNDKFSKQVRHYTLDSYYNLLHYGLRPGLSNEEYDTAWDLVVVPVLSQMVKGSGKGRYEACRVLQGLFTSSTNLWNANAALDAVAIKPEELPRLEPRWVRSRITRVLDLLEPVVQFGMQSSAGTSPGLDVAWQSLMQSIADAGAQEVKTTNDLKEAIACLVNVFRRLWSGCGSYLNRVDEDCSLKQYASLIETMLECLGPGAFAEEILATTNTDDIEVAPTPSHRPSKHHSVPMSPMTILLGQFCHPPGAVAVGQTWQRSVTKLLNQFVNSRTTITGKVELLNRSLCALTGRKATNADSLVMREIWRLVANTVLRILESEATPSNAQDSEGLGHAFRNALDILAAGLNLELSGDVANVLETFYDACFNTARQRAGDGGAVLAVMEPFAKSLLAANSSVTLENRLRLGSHMLKRPVWPRNRQSVDQAKKQLWGVGLAPHKATVFDPFEHLYALVTDYLTEAYTKLEITDTSVLDYAGEFTASAVEFLSKAPVSLLATALRKVQHGFATWAQDTARKTFERDTVFNLICTTWSSLIRLMRTLPSKDSNVLKALEPLLIAGFRSPHKAIVNKTILFWNETFGNEQTLDYPTELETILRARLVDAEIDLPTFPESNEQTVVASLPTFFESQNQLRKSLPKPVNDIAKVPRNVSVRRSALQDVFSSARQSPAGASTDLSSAMKRAQRSSGSSTPKARLRHNDSQVQFAPIDSSPIQTADESQLLTENQKEVKQRQQQDAQLFPGFSSSPLAQSTALPKAVPKRLDFTAEADQEHDSDAFGTPTGLPGANALVSDDIPSSPTPSSTKDASQGAIAMEDEREDEAGPQDPPPSPPRALEEEEQFVQLPEGQFEVGPDETTVDVTDYALRGDAEAAESEGLKLDHAEEPVADSVADEMVSASEYPSDSQLPTAQLQMEAEAAQKSSAEQPQEESQQDEQSSMVQEDDQDQKDESNGIHQKPPARAEPGQEEITRVENSFMEPAATGDNTEAQSTAGSQQSPKASKKRKRQSSTRYTTRKKKQQSPFKRIWSNFVGGNQQEDEDDMEEEIVVASSQPSYSPASNRLRQETASPSKSASQPVGEPTSVVKQEPTPMQPPPKRGRGRPRKSETPTPSQTEVQPEASKSLKRRASTISNGSVESSQVATSFVKDTPAPAKARKQQEGQTTRRTRASHQSESEGQTEQADETLITTKKATAVVVSPPHADADQYQRHGIDQDAAAAGDVENGSSTQLATPEDQLEGVADRQILTPRSILGRLKDALSDFRGMILGGQEEREFDDVLFELRRETHEAGRRGREL